MLGVLYLILAVFFGYNVLKRVLPGLFNLSNVGTLEGKPTKLHTWMALLPSSFLVGTLIVTWFTYFASYVFRSSENPLFTGNLISFAFFSALSVYFIILNRRGYMTGINAIKNAGFEQYKNYFRNYGLELLFIIAVTAIYGYLIFHSFSSNGKLMFVGYSVYSDFGPHLSMIRSFSLGSNFPTEYPHFPDGNVRYHFMFQFLAGNLEFLGMRIDWAFNLPSILSMVSFLMLLYSLAIVLTGKQWIGFISVFMYIFRSSPAAFIYFGENGLDKAFAGLSSITTHIGKTSHEEWGLWAQKTFINQRHFPFALGIMILIIIIQLPLLRKMVHFIKKAKEKLSETLCSNAAEKVNNSLPNTDNNKGFSISTSRVNAYISCWIKEFFFKANSWIPDNWLRPIFIGLILGLLSFWNGAVVVGTLPILFVMALFSKHRLEYLIIAVLGVGLTLLESAFFIGPGSSAADPRYSPGFLAQGKDILSIVRYYFELFGILPIILILGLIFIPKGGRWLAIAFIMPLVMATTIELTPDMAVNHKYVFMSIILLNIFAAFFLYRMFTYKNILVKITAGVLLFAMTVTGYIDFITLNNIDKGRAAMEVYHPVTKWAIEETKPDDVFLTYVHVSHPILLAGRKIYFGWPYFAWSAGYNTDAREAIVNEIYGGTDIQRVRKLAKENNISYIVIEEANRTGRDKKYNLNESLIRDNFERVYINSVDGIEIFKVQ